MPAKTFTKVEQPKKLRQCCSDDLTVDKWRFKLKTIGGWQLWWKINPKCCFIFLGTRSLIIMYRDVSECIGDRFSSRKSSPTRSDTFRYIPIRPDTSRFLHAVLHAAVRNPPYFAWLPRTVSQTQGGCASPTWFQLPAHKNKTAGITAISMASVSKQTRTIWRCA
jgi:hypothetical protein